MIRQSLILILASAGLAGAQTSHLPKLGPDAVSLTTENAYLRQAAAPDFWAFSLFVKPQFTSSACSVAAVLAAVNGLRGLPDLAEDTVLTQEALLELVGNDDWTTLSQEDGDGVTFEQLVTFTTAALEATGLGDLTVDSFRPASGDDTALEEMRKLLAKNEESAKDVLLVYYNQGVVTGDWDGPHVAVIGAYDAASDRVLVLEVDQEWYVPYWTPTEVLLEAMVKPTSDEHGPLEGETGGFVHVSR